MSLVQLPLKKILHLKLMELKYVPECIYDKSKRGKKIPSLFYFTQKHTIHTIYWLLTILKPASGYNCTSYVPPELQFTYSLFVT